MTYPTRVGPPAPGGLVSAIVPDSPADDAGLRAGDLIVLVEGEPVRDVIDWMWLADGPSVALEVRGADGAVWETILEREWHEGWGLEFDGVVFDGVRECDNACVFCFVAQLPPGMRPTLYVRDDDYRLSFLAGNFVTLTNLDDDDVDRIIEQRLTPLHVSLHAVDPAVRASLMCPTVEDRALEHMDTLLAAGIDLHVQVVLVPGLNDGAVLEQTLTWLAARPGIVSVGLVPVGVTRYQARIGSIYDTPESAAAVIAQVARWASRMHEERGAGWVYAADELYLAAGAPLPAWNDYDGFPQFENGIGMARAFIDETAEALADLPPRSGPAADSPYAVLVTGELFAPVLDSLKADLALAGCVVRVLPVANALLGGNVNVAGLLAGTDVIAAIAADAREHAGAHETYLVPDVAFNDDGLMLDDIDASKLAAQAGVDVRLVSSDAAGLVFALRELSPHFSG
jgi:putative radical SAM enzyme (TIGR03279 family)